MKIGLSLKDDLVIVGTGALVNRCSRWLRSRVKGKLYVFESGSGAASPLRKELSRLPDTMITAADAGLEENLLRLKPRLILSIGNRYIFRQRLIGCCPIINYHNALLPRHPGRNAEAWAIYEQDAATGVTWHLVNEQIDKGDIICQRGFALDDAVTSIKLLQEQSELAFAMFQGFFGQILDGQDVEVYPQKNIGNIKMHYSWERPNNGVLELGWPAVKISAFLRAMDYGRLQRLGRPYMLYEDRMLCWQRYHIERTGTQEDGVFWGDKSLCICKEGYSIRLSGIFDAGKLKEKMGRT